MTIAEHVTGGGVHRQSGRDITLMLGLAAAVGALYLLYHPLNQGPARIDLKTPPDEHIPLVTPFVVPYVSVLLLGPLTLTTLLVVDARLAKSALIAVVLTLVIAYVFYCFAQTHVPRPVVTGGDVFSRALRGVYGNDEPYNCFPSLHNALSVIIAVHWLRLTPRFGRYVAVWCGLIMASTLLVHQHYVADLAGGAAVAVVSCGVGLRLSRA
ncbi:phosphatase PAP2 family protein [Actinomadura meridiana]|uniref:Phosphatase PAP2 family protein n=1 Tax=Actinomadura meridiana TaxID=559626 RepID=A0ABP8BVH5_9ACTN